MSGWTSPLILGAFARGRRGRRRLPGHRGPHRQPMVDLSMFRSREFSGGIGTMMIWAFGILGIYFFTSLYLQQTLGLLAGQGRPGVRADGAVRRGVREHRAAGRGAGRGAPHGARSGCCSWWSAWSCSPGSACTRATPALLPGFMLFGAGAGLMNVPLTNAVMQAVPAARAGIAVRAAQRLARGRRAARHHGDRRRAADPAGRRAAGRRRPRARVRGRLPPRPARHDRCCSRPASWSAT